MAGAHPLEHGQEIGFEQLVRLDGKGDRHLMATRLAPGTQVGAHPVDDPLVDRCEQAALAGRGEPLVRGHVAHLRVKPVHQGAHTGRVIGPDRARGEPGQVVDGQLTFGERPAEHLRAEPRPGTAPGEILPVQQESAPALLLGRVQGLVGALDHRVDGLAVVRVEGDADARGHADLVAGSEHRPDQSVEDLGGDHGGVLGLGDIVEQEHELVAAQPGDRVRLAALALQPAGHLDEQGVADIVAEGVVDSLEAVQIEEKDRHPAAPPLGLDHRLSEPVAEQQPVGQAGEGIVMGQPVEVRLAGAQLLLDAQPVGDVAGHLDHPVERAVRVDQRRDLQFEGVVDAVAVVGGVHQPRRTAAGLHRPHRAGVAAVPAGPVAVGEQLVAFPPLQHAGRAAVADQPGRGLVDEQQLVVQADGHHRVGGAVDDRLQEIALAVHGLVQLPLHQGHRLLLALAGGDVPVGAGHAHRHAGRIPLHHPAVVQVPAPAAAGVGHPVLDAVLVAAAFQVVAEHGQHPLAVLRVDGPAARDGVVPAVVEQLPVIGTGVHGAGADVPVPHARVRGLQGEFAALAGSAQFLLAPTGRLGREQPAQGRGHGLGQFGDEFALALPCPELDWRLEEQETGKCGAHAQGYAQGSATLPVLRGRADRAGTVNADLHLDPLRRKRPQPAVRKAAAAQLGHDRRAALGEAGLGRDHALPFPVDEHEQGRTVQAAGNKAVAGPLEQGGQVPLLEEETADTVGGVQQGQGTFHGWGDRCDGNGGTVARPQPMP